MFGATATTPVEILNRSWSAVYTTPQTYKNQLAFLNATGSHQVSDILSIKGNAYVRNFRQTHVDGNTSDVQPCAVPAGFLCFGDDTTQLFAVGGLPVPDILNGQTPGSIDRTSTVATTFGGSAQITSTGKLAGYGNQLAIRPSLGRGNLAFNA